MTELHPEIQKAIDRIRNKAYTPGMKTRIGMVMTAGLNNDRELLKTLGNMEQYTWHEGRKIADPDHANPYNMDDRKKFFAAKG